YTRVLQQLTRTIPLVAMTEDMVRAGLVNSLARPGGNTTGISLLSPELDGKRLETLAEAAGLAAVHRRTACLHRTRRGAATSRDAPVARGCRRRWSPRLRAAFHAGVPPARQDGR